MRRWFALWLGRWRTLGKGARWGLWAFAGVWALGALFGGLQVYNRVESNPSFCRSCHTMEKAWDRWRTSAHRNIACLNCHEQSIFESTGLLVMFVLNRPNEVRKHAGISDESCTRCHESGNPQWIQVAQTAGHKVHFEEQRISCTKCHSISLHRFEPPAKICLVCHGEQEVAMTKMARRYCLDCHNYLREGGHLRPTRQSCLDCHQKQAQTKTHWPDNAPMRFGCSMCHHPHQETKPEVACLSCHRGLQAVKGKHTVTTHAAVGCTTCHKPHAWEVTTRDSCLACHGDKRAHNPGPLCSQCHSFGQQGPS